MIDYNLINTSLEYYSEKGFQRIEVPWLVTEAVDSITRPENIEPYIVSSKNKNLIASGEQGFLYLYLKNYLPKGCFQTVTPCFRNDIFDLTHTKYFIKNELIDTQNVSEKRLNRVVEIARNFFMRVLEDDVQTVQTLEGYDLTYNGIELGSYGIRSCDFLSWIYGTGCAEPRTSNLLKNVLSQK